MGVSLQYGPEQAVESTVAGAARARAEGSVAPFQAGPQGLLRSPDREG